MSSLILTTATRLLFPLMLVFSVYLLVRGHNEPGGGFVGGLVAATAFAMHALAHDAREARRTLRASPISLIAAGLAVAGGSGLLALASSGPFMRGVWWPHKIAVIGSLGTPVVFDLGVYLVVVGVTTLIVLELMEA